MRPVHTLGVFVPIALVLEGLGAAPSLIFASSALAIVPAAAVMGEATEELAARTGPGISGLVNVTFGNAPELIIAIFALADGLQEVVKASLVGSIVGNSLLVMGAAMLAGGRRRTRQRFDRTAARAQSGMLAVDGAGPGPVRPCSRWCATPGCRTWPRFATTSARTSKASRSLSLWS